MARPSGTRRRLPRPIPLLLLVTFTATLVAVLLALPDRVLFRVSEIEVFAMVPPLVLFPIVWTIYAPWWRSRIGRSLFIFSASLASLVMTTTIYQIFGDNYPYREHVRVFTFSWILLGVWYLLYSLIKTRMDVPRAERDLWWRRSKDS